MKKVLAMILAVAATAALAGGCGTSKQTLANEKSGAKYQTVDGKKIEVFTIWDEKTAPAGHTESKDLDKAIGKALAKQSGYAFEETFPSGSSNSELTQAFTLKLSNNDWGDSIKIYGEKGDWIDRLVKAKQVIALDKYFKDPKNYPNLAKIDKKILDNFRSSDGHIYAFPGFWYENLKNAQYGYWDANGWYVNKDILAQTGMTESDLSTIDGVETFLKKVKSMNLKAANGQPVIPMSGGQNFSVYKTIATTFGVTTYGMGWTEQNGKLVNYRDQDQFKKAIQWINKLNQEGLIDPEMLSQKNDALKTKMLNGRVALIPDQAWSFWSIMTAGESAATKAYTYINYPKVPGVKKPGIAVEFNPYGDQWLCVTSKCKDPDGLAKYADWMLTTGKYREWEMSLGPRGYLWDWDSSKGEPYYKFLSTDTETMYGTSNKDKEWQLGLSGSSGGRSYITPFNLDGGYFLLYSNKPNNIQWVIDMHKFNFKQGISSCITNFELTKMPNNGVYNQYVGAVNTVDVQYLSQCAAAKSDSDFTSAWNTYKSQLETQGHWSEINKEYKNCYNKQFGKSGSK